MTWTVLVSTIIFSVTSRRGNCYHHRHEKYEIVHEKYSSHMKYPEDTKFSEDVEYSKDAKYPVVIKYPKDTKYPGDVKHPADVKYPVDEKYPVDDTNLRDREPYMAEIRVEDTGTGLPVDDELIQSSPDAISDAPKSTKRLPLSWMAKRVQEKDIKLPQSWLNSRRAEQKKEAELPMGWLAKKSSLAQHDDIKRENSDIPMRFMMGAKRSLNACKRAVQLCSRSFEKRDEKKQTKRDDKEEITTSLEQDFEEARKLIR